MSEIQIIKDKAEQLRVVRASITKIEEEAKEATTPLKNERDLLQEELLEALREAGVNSIKVDTGESFARTPKRSLVVTNEAKAMYWAKENNAFSIDKRIVAQKLKDVEELPEGFEPRESFYISIRKPIKK